MEFVCVVDLTGIGSGIGMSRKKNFPTGLGLDFGSILRDKEKEVSETDIKFNEIMQRSGRLIINGKVK
jgi:hypothetical protein